MIPGIGRFNWPQSMLAWDVLVLNGYLALNLAIPCYVHFCHYRGRQPLFEGLFPLRRAIHVLGDIDPHGDGVSVFRQFRAAVLAHRPAGAALHRHGLCLRPGSDHHRAADPAPHHALPGTARAR
jgi:hypothetical protein